MARYLLVVDLDRRLSKAERLASTPAAETCESETTLQAAVARHVYDARVERLVIERLPGEDAAAA